MKYLYFITYSLNILILCLIFLDILKLDEFDYFIKNDFSTIEKILTISFLFILYICLAVLNLPVTPFVVMYSAALLGAIETIIYIFFASSIGVYFSLLVNRHFNRKIKFIQNKLSKMNLLFKPNIFYIILLRIIPIVPFSWITIYVSNTNFSAKKFLFANCVGCLVPITLSAYLGKSIIENNLFMFSIIFAIFIFLMICGKLLNKYLTKKTINS
jgi:uncharacterized membrane protein YdjX (TVP38/TMEM64 family)